MNIKLTLKGCVFFLALLIFVLLALNASAETVKIDGTVVDFYGAVEDAEVFVVDAENVNCGTGSCRSEGSTDAETDAGGNFEIYILPPDYNKKYNITVIKENYETKVKQVTLNHDSRNQSLGEIELEGIANVEGTIIDEDSKRGVEGVKITINKKKFETDSDGGFLAGNITAKNVKINVKHSDYNLLNFVYDLKPGDNFLKINVSKKDTSKDYAVSFNTDAHSVLIAPGETKKFEVDIKNAGLKDAEFEINLLETEENFSYRILNEKGKEIESIFIESKRIAKIYVEVKVPANAVKGEYEFLLKSDPGDNEIMLTADVGTTVKYGFFAYSIHGEKAVFPGSEVKFEVNVRNNEEGDIYELEAMVPSGWKYNITNARGSKIKEIEIAGGNELNLYLSILIPANEDEGIYEPGIKITGLKGKDTKTLFFRVNVLKPESDDWPMFMHDLEHTGETSGIIENPKNLEPAWNLKTAGITVGTSPEVSENYVYFGSGSGSGEGYRGLVYRIDKNTGELSWEIKIKNPVSSSPAVSRNYVYVGSLNGCIYCLDKNTGELIWKFQTEGPVKSSPAIYGNYVYVGSSDNYTYCLDKNTGGLIWKSETGDNSGSSPAISGNYVYIGSVEGYVYCIDKNTGEFLWKFQTGYPVYSSPAISGNYVYAGSGSGYGPGSISVSGSMPGFSGHEQDRIGYIYCLNKSTGEFVWKFQTGSGADLSLAISGGYVYAGSDDEYIYCIDKKTGELAWKFQTGSGYWIESLAVSENHVYASSNLGSYKGYIYCLDKNTGELLLKLETGGLTGPFAISGEYIYAGIAKGGNSYVYAFKTFKQEGDLCLKDSECRTGNCFNGVCMEEGYCNSDQDCFFGQHCSGNTCENLKPSWASCLNDSECRTGNCFNGVCMEEGYCDSDVDCSSDMYCSENKCKNLQPDGLSCSDSSECITGNCFNGVCREKGYIEMPWVLIPGVIVFLIFLVLVYFAVVKNKRSNLMLMGILILIIIQVILIANASDLFKSDVVDRFISENETLESPVFIKIKGTTKGIEVETYKGGVLDMENFPAGNCSIETGYGSINLDEDFGCSASGNCEVCCNSQTTLCSTNGCYVRRNEEEIEIKINDPGKELETDILKSDNKFKELTKDREWKRVIHWQNCDESLSLAYCPDVHLWFVVDDRMLYLADIDTWEYEVRFIAQAKDVGEMTEEEIRKTAEQIENEGCS